MERKGEENYIKKGEKGLKNASFRSINSKKNWRGWGLPAFASFWVINSKNFRPDRRKLIRRKRTKNGNGIKNASFWAINSTARPPQTYSSEKKMNLKRGGGEEWSECTIYTPGQFIFFLSVILIVNLSFLHSLYICRYLISKAQDLRWYPLMH